MADKFLTDLILTEFVRRLQQRAEIADFALAPWVKRGQTREGTYNLTGGINALLHVQAATDAERIWRLSKELLSDFGASGRKWGVVLLLRSAETGYLLPALEVRGKTGSGEWPLAGDAYEITQGLALNPVHFFKEFDTLILRLLTRGLL